jgi:hypothetical protein
MVKHKGHIISGYEQARYRKRTRKFLPSLRRPVHLRCDGRDGRVQEHGLEAARRCGKGVYGLSTML